jgi:hypothetical protein
MFKEMCQTRGRGGVREMTNAYVYGTAGLIRCWVGYEKNRQFIGKDDVLIRPIILGALLHGVVDWICHHTHRYRAVGRAGEPESGNAVDLQFAKPESEPSLE